MFRMISPPLVYPCLYRVHHVATMENTLQMSTGIKDIQCTKTSTCAHTPLRQSLLSSCTFYTVTVVGRSVCLTVFLIDGIHVSVLLHWFVRLQSIAELQEYQQLARKENTGEWLYRYQKEIMPRLEALCSMLENNLKTVQQQTHYLRQAVVEVIKFTKPGTCVLKPGTCVLEHVRALGLRLTSQFMWLGRRCLYRKVYSKKC